MLDNLLAEYTLGIVPADYDPKNPVGTGAVQVQVVHARARTASSRSTTTTGATRRSVDELHIQDFADPSAQVNALQAGQVQTIDNLPYNLIDTVKGQGGQIIESESGAWVPFTMRVDIKPFSDVRVRQAMRLIADRQQMIDNALSGYGSPRQRPLRAVRPGLRQGPAPARAGHRPGQVAAQGGRPGGPPGPAVHRRRHRVGGAGERDLFVEQAKKAGVDVKVVKKNPFYGDDYLSYPFAQDFWNTRNYLPQAAVGVLKGGTYNETHFDKSSYAKFAGLIAAAQKEIDEDKRNTLLQDAQEIEYDEGGYIIWGFRDQVDGHSSKVVGPQAEQVPAARAPTTSRPSRSRADR